MKLFDTNLEILAVRTLLESSHGGMPLLGKLKTELFGSDGPKQVVSRVKMLVESGREIPSIHLLRNDQALTDEARALLQTDIEPLDSPDNIDQCIDKLRQYRNARILFETIKKSTEEMMGSNPEFSKVLAMLEGAVVKCRSSEDQSEMEVISSETIDAYMKIIDETLNSQEDNFIQSGFADFDREYGGFNRGNVALLAAPSGRGKSAMMVQMAVLMYMMGLNVCVISFEMTNAELRERAFSCISKLEHQDIRLRRLIAEQKQLLKKKMRQFVDTGSNNRLVLWGTSENLDVNDIHSITKPLNFDVVFIDYLGLLKQPENKQMHEILGNLTRDCKRMAKANNQLVIPLAQLDDETLKIKYSKAIQANCDWIWAWELNQKEKEASIVCIDQMKVRHGPQKPFYLRIDLSRMTWTDHKGPVPNLKMERQDQQNNDKKPMPRMSIG